MLHSDSRTATGRPSGWDGMEACLHAVAAAVKESSGLVHFYRTVAQELELLPGFRSLNIWQTDDSTGTAQLIVQAGDCPLGMETSRPPRLPDNHQSFAWIDTQPTGGASVYRMVSAAVELDRIPVTILSVIVPTDDDHEGDSERWRQLLSAVCELATDFHRDRELRQLRSQVRSLQSWNEFVAQITHCQSLEQLAFELANEGRRLTACDRVTVLRSGPGLTQHVQAISGQANVDHRAADVRFLESLATAVATGPTGRFDSQDLHGSGQAAGDCWRHHAAGFGSARHAAGLTLRASSGEVLGTLVFESFDEVSPFPQRGEILGTVARVAATATQALNEAAQGRLDALRRLVLGNRPWSTRRLTRSTLVLAGLAGLLAVACLPAELRIRGDGELVPTRRQIIYAPLNARVGEVFVEHGDLVAEGRELVVLHSDELEFESSRLLGQILTYEQRLTSVGTRRLAMSRGGEQADREYQRLGAEEQEIQVMLKGLRNQLAILDQRRDQLTISAPLRGTIATWDIDEQLQAGRPVSQGQPLLIVADTEGLWELELWVRDDRIGYLREAQAARKSPLPVRFKLATDPGRIYSGQMHEISPVTELNSDAEPIVRVRIEFDREQPLVLRPGATAIAWIDCGTHPLYRVWFHDLLDATRRLLFF